MPSHDDAVTSTCLGVACTICMCNKAPLAEQSERARPSDALAKLKHDWHQYLRKVQVADMQSALFIVFITLAPIP